MTAEPDREARTSGQTTTRRSVILFLKTFLSLPASRSITARTLIKLFLTSMKLMPVALAAQCFGMAAIDAVMRTKPEMFELLLVWSFFGFAQLIASLAFVRSLWRDARRVERVRLWIRRWTILASCAGLLWGAAGAVIMVPLAGVQQLVAVAVIVAVTFASWPVYSCWMPSLTAFTLLSLTPMTISVAAQYGVSQAIMALVLITVTGFILYSGRRLNEMLLSSILNDDENQRLVQRLKVEVNRTEAARLKTQHESERRAQFFAAANHDLRQPLQAMGIFLEMLKRRSTSQTLPIVEQLGRTSSTISTLVEQVLEVTRMEFGRLELHPEVIWLPELMEELSHDFTAIAAEKGLRFRVKSVPAAVCTDPLLLKRALKNLITNAIRYTDKPGAEVVVGARRLGSSRVSIGVYDAGPGLTTEDKARIFETFYRGSAGKKSTSEGFGLGLSIVKRICRQLGIEFSMGSKLGRGSVFRLVLNLTEGEQVEMLERSGAPAVINSRLGGTTALLEDNPFVNEALSAKLSLWGTDVVAAPAFSEDFVKRVQASAGKTGRLVLLTDYNLGAGELTGLEASTELSSRLGMNVPTVLLTAVAGDLIEADWTQARKKGKAGRMPEVLPQILQKPADDVALNSALVRAGRNAAYWRSEEPVESNLETAEDPGGDEGKTDGRTASEGAASSSSGTPEPNEVVRGI